MPLTSVSLSTAASPVARLLPAVRNIMFSQVVTYIILSGTLLLLFNVLFSGAFLAKPPHGDRAMILVVPMLGTILAGLLLLIAAIIAGSRSPVHALGLIHSSRPWCFVIAIVVTLGIAVGCFSTFIAWANSARVQGHLEFLSLASHWLSGVVAPLVLAIALLVATQGTHDSIASHPVWARAVKVLFSFTAALSVIGYLHIAGDLYGAVAHHRKYAPYGTISQLMPDEYIRQRTAGKVTNNIPAELAKLGPDAPLWNVTALLVQLPAEPVQPTQDRRLVLERAAAIDDLDTQVTTTLFHAQPILRRGVFLFIASAPKATFNDHSSEWATPLQLSIDDTTNSLSGRPEWVVDRNTNPDPVAFVSELVDAAQRFRATPQYPALKSSLSGLSAAISRLAPSPERDQMLKILHAAGIS